MLECESPNSPAKVSELVSGRVYLSGWDRRTAALPVPKGFHNAPLDHPSNKRLCISFFILYSRVHITYYPRHVDMSMPVSYPIFQNTAPPRTDASCSKAYCDGYYIYRMQKSYITVIFGAQGGPSTPICAASICISDRIPSPQCETSHGPMPYKEPFYSKQQ